MNPDQFIHDRVRIAGRYILPSVRQLIFITEHGEPEPVGSCALLWHRARRYLVSAAHVLDVFRSHPLSIGTASSWHTLEGEFRATNVPATGKREDDAYDYAFMLLSDRDASALDGCHFLTADQVASGETPIFNGQTRSKYLAIGWPRNRLNFDRRNKVTEPENVAYTGAIASSDLYRRHKRDPRIHLLVEFDRKQMSGPEGPRLPPSLDGLSGGGIFAMPGLQRVGDVAPPRLVAITTELWPQHDLLVGTRIDLVFAAIEAAA